MLLDLILKVFKFYVGYISSYTKVSVIDRDFFLNLKLKLIKLDSQI